MCQEYITEKSEVALSLYLLHIRLGVPADKVGAEAGEMLLNQLCHGGCVDDFLQDQVVGIVLYPHYS